MRSKAGSLWSSGGKGVCVGDVIDDQRWTMY